MREDRANNQCQSSATQRDHRNSRAVDARLKEQVMVSSLQELTTYLIDLDGVIYRGEELIEGAKEFVAWLNAHNKKYLFLTNNSFASEQQVVQKLTRLGIATDASHVMGAAQAAVQYIQRHTP